MGWHVQKGMLLTETFFYLTTLVPEIFNPATVLKNLENQMI